MFEYLYHHNPGSRVVFDVAEPEVNMGQFKEVNCKSIYVDLTESIPLNMPEPKGNAVIISMFCDTSFASDLVTRRSQSVILIFLNGTLDMWYSMQHNTVEASTFGLEFIALRVGCEMNYGLRYTFQMMGVSIKGPTNVYSDNEAVISNSRMAELTL